MSTKPVNCGKCKARNNFKMSNTRYQNCWKCGTKLKAPGPKMRANDESKIAEELIKIAQDLTSHQKTAKVVKTKFTDKYKKILSGINKLPWDAKPRKGKQSAMHFIQGKINGKSVEFAWHQPSTEWGPQWAFLGVYIDHKEMFHQNGNKLLDSNLNIDIGNRPIEWLYWVKNGEQGLDTNLVRQNIQEFELAVLFCLGL